MGEADFLALDERQRSFEHVAAFSPSSIGFTLTGLGSPQMIPGTSVTSDFFSVLGIQPVLGRAFLPEEGKPGTNLSVIVSHRFWEQFLHAALMPSAIGSSLTEKHTVIGVLPLDFTLPFITNCGPSFSYNRPKAPAVLVADHGPPQTSISETRAAADASLIARQVRTISDNASTIVVPTKDFTGMRARPVILLGAVGFVLLIAVVNVANLQLSRSGSRARIAIRSALSAGRRN
jgi:hypothetical protein